MASRTGTRITSAAVAAQARQVLLPTYATVPVALVRGEGSWVWDAEGRRYLDCVQGIAVNTLGHSHPAWVEAVRAQAGVLTHVSNLFQVPDQVRLAERLCDRAGPGRVFFSNSGAEANEALLKLARLWGRERAGGQEGQIFKVITAEKGFHGRTFGGMSATPQAKIQGGFRPLLPGFAHAPFNDLAAFEAAVDDATAAILVETIQGEGGVLPAERAFLQGLRTLCDARGLLLLIDEVQCGIGRTGTFYAYEQAGIVPDAIGMAKGLGGGFPIGAVWVRAGYHELFAPGSHGTTFGGNPLACSAAHAVLDVLEADDLLAHVRAQGAQLTHLLDGLVRRHDSLLSGHRGIGFHRALVFRDDPAAWVARLREQGLLVVRGGTDALRLLPPLNVTALELEAAVDILDVTLGLHGEG